MKRIAVSSLMVGLLFVGCYERKPVWMPDSSGFLYAVNNQDDAACVIYHYDLHTKTERKVVRCDRLKADVLAIRPDGKRFAVTRLIDTRTRSLARVFVYDLEGRLVDESQEFVVGNGNEFLRADSEVSGSVTHWSPDKRHILIDGRRDAVGILDLDSDTTKKVDDVSLPAMIEPILPDGSGFIGQADDSLVIVDWNGQQRSIKGVRQLDFTKELLAGAWWEGNYLVTASVKGRVVVDTLRSEARVEEDARVQRYGRTDGKTATLIFNFGRSYLRLKELRGDQTEIPKFDLSIGDFDGSEPTTVLKGISDVSLPTASPNQKYVAFSYIPAGSDVHKLAIFDANGNYPAKSSSRDAEGEPKRRRGSAGLVLCFLFVVFFATSGLLWTVHRSSRLRAFVARWASKLPWLGRKLQPVTLLLVLAGCVSLAGSIVILGVRAAATPVARTSASSNDDVEAHSGSSGKARKTGFEGDIVESRPAVRERVKPASDAQQLTAFYLDCDFKRATLLAVFSGSYPNAQAMIKDSTTTLEKSDPSMGAPKHVNDGIGRGIIMYTGSAGLVLMEATATVLGRPAFEKSGGFRSVMATVFSDRPPESITSREQFWAYVAMLYTIKELGKEQNWFNQSIESQARTNGPQPQGALVAQEFRRLRIDIMRGVEEDFAALVREGIEKHGPP